jgi:predicted translin family RNA/ssDNA-binding protein
MTGRMVQDCLAEDFDHATHHRDKLQKELAEMGKLLKKFGEVQIASSSKSIEPSTPQTNERVEIE